MLVDAPPLIAQAEAGDPKLSPTGATAEALRVLERVQHDLGGPVAILVGAALLAG